MYGLFLFVTVLSNVIFAFAPTRAVKNSLAELKDSKSREGFVVEMSKLISIYFASKNIAF